MWGSREKARGCQTCKTSLSVKTCNPVTSSNQIRKEQETWTASEIYSMSMWSMGFRIHGA